jgi:hypothetical protein
MKSWMGYMPVAEKQASIPSVNSAHGGLKQSWGSKHMAEMQHVGE